MTQIRIPVAADLLGVSDDTVRRWVDAGRLAGGVDDAGRKSVDGAELAALAQELADGDRMGEGARSARNHLTGLVTRVVSDTVMSQVEMQCGPFTVVSLMSAEAARELHLQPGSVAVAVVKATTVIVETPGPA